ncbi:MAG: hypothetical protein KC589_10190 [Nanoarchaeota archaeon]|nr:hypothetical protein [Nanoarchaeota archaeon]
MSSEDQEKFIENSVKGATKAVIKYSEEKIKELANSFRNKNVAFIKDKETIDLVREQANNNELLLFKQYIGNRDYLVLFKLGLTLRKVHNDEKKLKNIQEKIKLKYKLDGLHIAYFIQNGLFSRYVINIIDNGYSSVKGLKKEIEFLFENIRSIVSFVHNNDNVKNKSREIVNTIDANKPYCFMISAMGNAMKVADKIKDNVEKKLIAMS